MYKQLNVTVLRDRVRSLVIDQQMHQIFDPPGDSVLRFPPPRKFGHNVLTKSKQFLYEYYRLALLAQHAAVVSQPSVMEQQLEDGTPLALAITTADLNGTTLPLALTAWLTIDSFRWSPIYEVPEDLSYGLVLSYPTYILAIASFVLKIDRAEQIEKLAPGALGCCEEIALSHSEKTVKSPVT